MKTEIEMKSFFATFLLSAGFCLATLPGGAAEEARLVDEPYGVCCHVTRGEKWDAPKLYPLMREAGVSMVRSDWDWRYQEDAPGKFNPKYDLLIENIFRGGMDFLPILPGNQPKFGQWAWNHLDDFGRFVRRNAEKYGKQIRYWEFCNEPNSGGAWNPTAEEYAPLLERAWRELKTVDPELQVVYAGLAGVPVDWVEKTFKRGAHRHFDVMNVHPYCSVPEQIPQLLHPLQELMKQYGVVDKPVWISEVGWSATPTPAFYLDILPEAVRTLGLEPADIRIALVCDAKRGFIQGMDNFSAENFPEFAGIHRISLEELKTLDPKEFPVLIPARHEKFVLAYIPELVRYVRDGGTLVLPSGLPFYFDMQLDGKGGCREVQVNDKYMADFHIGWDAWWTNPAAPKAETNQRPAAAFREKFRWSDKDSTRAGRFLSTRNLKPGDRFIPLLEADGENGTFPLAGIYRLNSDLKGNVIMMTGANIYHTNREKQGEFLPRAYLCGFAAGAERIFWYCFRDTGRARNHFESHFGLLDRDNRPKFAYQALKTLTRLLPGGSTVPRLTTRNDVCLATWTRPDQTRVWALWSAYNRQEGAPVTLRIDGDVTAAMNHLGETRPAPNSGEKVTATGSILYLVGPESVTFSGE